MPVAPDIIHEIPEHINESGSRTPQARDREDLRDNINRQVDSDYPDQLMLGRYNRPESNHQGDLNSDSDSMSLPAVISTTSRMNSNISP
jgi:hypothetical protein